MHKIFFLSPSTSGELSVICFPSKLHFEELNPFYYVGPSCSCVCVFVILSLHISLFYFYITLICFYFFWLIHVFILNHYFCTIIFDDGVFLVILVFIFWLFCYLDHFPCLMNAHLHMSLFSCFLPPFYFQLCHNCDCLHLFKISHLLCFVSCCLCLWLGYLRSTQILDTPRSFLDDYP